MKKKKLTFGGYPCKFDVVENDVHITCKGVVGKLSQGEAFLKSMRTTQPTDCYFGKSLITRNGRDVSIDCLEDTIERFKTIYSHAKSLLDESRNNIKSRN